MTAHVDTRSGDFPQPPPPPPPPSDALDTRAIKERLRQDQQMLRERRLKDAKAKLTRVNNRYYAYAGGIVALALGAVACRSYAQDQRDTAMALAQLSVAGRAEQQTPATTIVQEGIPNPLAALPLSNQAKWNIGAGGDGVLPPKRSTTVITALLERVDLCNVWVGLNDKANVVVAFEPAPGFTPLLEAGQCADTQGQTVVPVPSDPVPTSSTVAQ